MIHTCPCGAEAIIRAEIVGPTGDDPDYGQYMASYWCQEHATLLVRTTTERYRLVELVTTPRGSRKIEGQQQWDLD